MARIHCPGLALVLAFLTGSPDALACACCTNEGQRSVGTVALDSGKRQLLESLRFGNKANLFTGEADVETVEGITAPSGSYDITVRWDARRLVFSFRDQKGRYGALMLALSSSISVFEVDPRNGADHGQGPKLYKEWKLSATPAATNAFAAGGGPPQILTLIIHGHGNSCTDAGDFTHWTLVMQGPRANYTLFGELVTTK